MRNTLLLAATAVSLLQACTTDTSYSNSTEHGTPGDGGSAAMVAGVDQEFAQDAAMGGMAEVELGRLAASKATNPRVVRFGQQMITDHGKANEELKEIARMKHIPLPKDLDEAHRTKKQHLEQFSGTDFDRAYVDAMVHDHEKDLDHFEQQAANGSDPELKGLRRENGGGDPDALEHDQGDPEGDQVADDAQGQGITRNAQSQRTCCLTKTRVRTNDRSLYRSLSVKGTTL